MSEINLEGLSPAGRRAIASIAHIIKYLMLCERAEGLTEAHEILVEETQPQSSDAEGCRLPVSIRISNRITEINDARMNLLENKP